MSMELARIAQTFTDVWAFIKAYQKIRKLESKNTGARELAKIWYRENQHG